jgi:hypothetical protein
MKPVLGYPGCAIDQVRSPPASNFAAMLATVARGALIERVRMAMHKTFQALAFLTVAAATCGVAVSGAAAADRSSGAARGLILAQQDGPPPSAKATPLPTPPALMTPLTAQSSGQLAPTTLAVPSAPAPPASTLVNTPAQK